LGSAQDAFGFQPDLLQVTATTVLTITWSPLMLVTLDGVGTPQMMMGRHNRSHHVDLRPPKDGVVGG